MFEITGNQKQAPNETGARRDGDQKRKCAKFAIPSTSKNNAIRSFKKCPDRICLKQGSEI